MIGQKVFDVRLSHEAEKFYHKTDEKLKSRLNIVFHVLSKNPVPARIYDLKKITGEENSYRIRLSRYRMVYTVFWDEKVIRVTKIEQRDEHTYD